MKLTKIAQMKSGQDGAFFGNYMFRFNAKGKCTVYDARPLDTAEGGVELPIISTFTVNEADSLVPHFNAVVFGEEYFAEGDEFPLLYANIYNNYAKTENRREGMCCVYRLVREGTEFSMTMVQVIRIGFTDTDLWRSANAADVRPYGNFVIDRARHLLHAFVMRDEEHVTRYFTFDLPRLAEGEMSAEYGVPTVVLSEADVKDYFDVPYHNFIQGACCEGGLIYSSEGFNEKVHPALRVISPAERRQIAHTDLTELGEVGEAEWIDFRGGKCYYSDGFGAIFTVDFEL